MRPFVEDANKVVRIFGTVARSVLESQTPPRYRTTSGAASATISAASIGIR